ncbi:6952_t:CDS:2, partial [Paraglomus occultum]
DGGLNFNPATGTITAGSIITFDWVGSDTHSVLQTDDDNCTPSTKRKAFKTGENTNGFTATFKVPANKRKLWFMCGVPGHCEAGMKLALT